MDNFFIVIVLYNTKLEDSKTLISLNNFSENEMNVFIYDNSSIPLTSSDSFKFNKLNISYFSDLTNPGISKAYNMALKIAFDQKKKWILLLDQDTELSESYLKEIKKIDFNSFPKEIVAVIPNIVSSENVLISPAKMFIGGICIPLKLKNGIISKRITSINSGVIINTDFINSIGGFSLEFPLDMLDHWYFKKIYDNKKSVFLLNSCIKQELSVSKNFQDNVSYERYKKMLSSENKFIKDQSVLGLIIFKIRLFLRVLKQIRYKNSNYYKLTIKYLFSSVNA
jgi:GT2 family glycosyltransferase